MSLQPRDRPFEAASATDRRIVFGGLGLLAAVLVLGTVVRLFVIGDAALYAPPENLWINEPAPLDSYAFVAHIESEFGVRDLRQWAAAPDRWRVEDSTFAAYSYEEQVSDGYNVWAYFEAFDTYWAIPFETTLDGRPQELPRLQDGRPIFRTRETVSTRANLRTWQLGPTTSEYLMRYVLEADRHGKWSLSTGRFLDRDVQVLDIELYVTHRRVLIDPEYLFILYFEDTGGDEPPLRYEITELHYNEPIPDDDVFVFVPPEGARNCLPPQFVGGCAARP